MDRMIVNVGTGETNLMFENSFEREVPKNCVVVNCVEVEEENAEVVLYPNADKNSPFDFVMETDLISDDFTDTEEEPIKYAIF